MTGTIKPHTICIPFVWCWRSLWTMMVTAVGSAMCVFDWAFSLQNEAIPPQKYGAFEIIAACCTGVGSRTGTGTAMRRVSDEWQDDDLGGLGGHTSLEEGSDLGYYST